MLGFAIDQARITTKCDKCGGFAFADFNEDLWICENGHKFSITIRELKKLSVDWDKLMKGYGKKEGDVITISRVSETSPR